ncbi:MAG: quinone oxidoreductase [Ardenticatenaceae bacterium]|nr:quinone oxidoreductase [Ardenticatenaceae bacterium]
MKAIRVHETGGPEVMQLDDVPLPEPGPGEVRLKVSAAGLNFIDVYHRKGQYAMTTPFLLGREAGGIVDMVGEGVLEVKPGERVAYPIHPGGYAEYVIVPAWKLVPVPHDVDLGRATAVMLQGMTAHYLATSTYPLGKNDTALVHAAAGGVGLLLVQLAKWRGARVIGTVSTEEKAQLARAAGADEVILYTQADFETETMRLTAGAGVNVIYDSVGATTFKKGLNCLRRRGYMVLYGQSSGPVGSLDPQILNSKGSVFLTRPSLGDYIADRDELLARADDLFGLMRQGRLDVRVDRTFPLAQAAEAHRYMEGRQTKGKVLLIP